MKQKEPEWYQDYKKEPHERYGQLVEDRMKKGSEKSHTSSGKKSDSDDSGEDE